MSDHQVHSSAQIEVAADQVWSHVRDFCRIWHPAIATMAREHDDAGHLLRAFSLHGDDGTYRERLTWFSDSERSMAYTHVEGIDGVDCYDARLQVTAHNKSRCSVTMSAKLCATEPRATQIAEGTQAIFDQGIAAITQLAQQPAVPENSDCKTCSDEPQSHRVEGLSVSCHISAANNNDILCLFLHGIGGNRHNWNGQLSAVAPCCNVAALDLRGYGQSSLGDKQSTIDDYCADILRVADTFKAKKLVLCGLSYGAWIATSFAHRYPDRLAGLVLSGGCTGMSEASAEEREAFRKSREGPLNAGKTPADFAPDVVAVLAGPDISDECRETLLASMSAITPATYADALRCFTNPAEQFDFASLTMPVLLMTGEEDKLAPPEEINQVAERVFNASAMPDVRYECVSAAGHVCNLEKPDAYNRPLVELLRRLVP